jgi:hypothetical protein
LDVSVTGHLERTIVGGVLLGVLPLLIGWKFNIAGVSLTGSAAYVAAAATGVSAALVVRFSIRHGVRD